MTRVGWVPTVGDALRRHYRPDCLHRDRESAARLAASCEADLARDGFAILASRHESTTGFALWVRPEEDGFAIYGRGWDGLSPAR
jgi:hypothetical protein